MPAEREARFEYNGNVLQGTVLYPQGDGPWPGIVTLQGSGSTTRDNFDYFPAIWEIFLERGIAVFAYDKPGVGQSSGDWRELTLTERADEALEATRLLKSDPQVDSTCVGLFGHSQGGWVAPIAASRDAREVAFVIVQSGPGITAQAQCVHDVEHSMRGDGYPEDVIDAGVAFMRSLVMAGERNMSYEDVSRELLSQNMNHPWWEYFEIDDEKTWAFFRRSWREDPPPSEVWRNIHCPVLAMFGEDDHLLPVEASVSTIREALDATGNTDVTISVIAGANHQFLISEPAEFTPGYKEAIRSWIERHRRPS